MKCILTIEADSFAEIDSLFHHNSGAPGYSAVRAFFAEPDPEPAAEEEVVEPAPKKPRSRKAPTVGAAEPSSTEDSQADLKSSATVAEKSTVPDEEVKFEDLRAAASPLLEAGRGKDIQDMLAEKFDGARAFGALKKEQYPAALAELQNLAA